MRAGTVSGWGFIYDKRAVRFNGLAAEANAPRAKRGVEYLPALSFGAALT